ncbi:2Fe-2S iron-sulfur cluster-binding protein [Hydrogenophaga sp. A37]|uniref:2Fe-2S iron-sulfur cluster-binding protein n=1 Tax=Hydrogenophaga sp. A37 TaxID=1945864 RepID=UPI000984F8A7|nr:2Fe-2S iron-sulfur cluster binding domain-containing protein [Hydrogenophaga sp. A37]OOG87124.1 ferredoxin [Hydrogenophaga sp. A37]
MRTSPEPDTFQLHLPHKGETLTVPAETTLLRALLDAGVPWPASCRNGTCRACIGQLVSGTVRYSVAWPGLLPEEKAKGCVLPCVASPTSDVVLAPPID